MPATFLYATRAQASRFQDPKIPATKRYTAQKLRRQLSQQIQHKAKQSDNSPTTNNLPDILSTCSNIPGIIYEHLLKITISFVSAAVKSNFLNFRHQS